MNHLKNFINAILQVMIAIGFLTQNGFASLPTQATDHASPQAEKGINTATAAKENQGQSAGHRKDGDHANTALESFMAGPLSSSQNEGKTKGENAVTVLTKVSEKVPEKAKGAVLKARDKIAARLN